MNTNVKVIIAALSIALVGAVGTAAYFAGSANSAKAETPAITASEPVAAAVSAPVAASEPVVASEPAKEEAPKPVVYKGQTLPAGLSKQDQDNYKVTCIDEASMLNQYTLATCLEYHGHKDMAAYCSANKGNVALFAKAECEALAPKPAQQQKSSDTDRMADEIYLNYQIQLDKPSDIKFFHSYCMQTKNLQWEKTQRCMIIIDPSLARLNKTNGEIIDAYCQKYPVVNGMDAMDATCSGGE